MPSYKEEFISIYREHIHREGADALLEYLSSRSSDFFTAPASTRFHGAYEGGLVEHSVNVYHCLKDYLARQRVRELYHLTPSEETVAIVALLHDLCKINCYKPGFRNVKDENGQWKRVEIFEFDDKLPYGHGEKSMYILTGYMKTTREEAFAIRYHMGFSSTEDVRNVSKAFEMFPLAFVLHAADMEASLFLETRGHPAANAGGTKKGKDADGGLKALKI